MFRFPTAAAAKQKWPRASQWPPTGGKVRRRRFWAAAVFSFFDLVLFHLFFSLPHPLVRVLHRLVTGCFSFFFVRPTLKSPPGGTCLPQKCENRYYTHISVECFITWGVRMIFTWNSTWNCHTRHGQRFGAKRPKMASSRPAKFHRTSNWLMQSSKFSRITS